MKVFATTGYYGSGSSAVTDLLKEYNNVYSSSDYEISFFFGYEGITNLYYWLVRGKRLQSKAVSDFWNGANVWASFGKKLNYEIYFRGNFIHYTKEYLDNLRGKVIGRRYEIDFTSLSKIQRYIWRIWNKLFNIPNLIYNATHSDVRQDYTRLFAQMNVDYLYDIDKDDFIRYTHDYLERLFRGIIGNNHAVMVDGLISTLNIDDISPYFDDLRTTIVKRDPRDIYLSDKHIWKTGVVPADTTAFINWYRNKMNSYHVIKSKVMYLNFEDMVFRYDSTVRKIEDFFTLDAESHLNPKTYFIPERSAQNCRLWEKYPGERENISQIESELADWLYPY